MSNATILVVDDEQLIRWSLAQRLRSDGYQVARSADGTRGARARSARAWTSCCSTTSCPTSDGVTVLRRIKEHDPDILVILLTAYATVETAVEAMKIGAYHFANKPFDLDDVAMMVQKALETTRLRRELRMLRASQAQPYALLAHRRRVTRDRRPPHPAAARRAQSRHDGAADGRERHGQGPGGEGPALQQRSGQRPVHEHHVLGDPRRAARERALRPRARRVHRRTPAEARPARVVGRRHGVPRRDRRNGPRAAGEAAPVPRGEDLQARGRHARHPRGCPGDRRDQPESRRAGEGRQVPRRPLLPSQRPADRAAAAAVALDRHSARSSISTWTSSTASSGSPSAARRRRR